MLRHLLMTPPAEPRRVLPRKLQNLAYDVIRPLYYYVVPHKLSKRNETELTCTCPFPLFTLCTPRTSPYDVTDKEQNVTSEVASNTLASEEEVLLTVTQSKSKETIAKENTSHVVGEFPVKTPLMTFKNISSSNVSNKKRNYKKINRDFDSSNNVDVHAQQDDKLTCSKLDVEQQQQQEEIELEEMEESHKKFDVQVKPPGTRRLKWSRTLLRPWELWRKQNSAYMNTIHPNVIPGRPACYRCDICDGFQCHEFSKPIITHSCSYDSEINSERAKSDSENNSSNDDANVSKKEIENNLKSRAFSRIASKRAVGQLTEVQCPSSFEVEQYKLEQQEEQQEQQEQETRDDNRGNVHKKQRNVDVERQVAVIEGAESRYLDPFHVEVFDRPALSSLAFNLIRQFYAQLRRCNIHVYELSKRVKYVPLNSNRNARGFDNWVKQERKRRFNFLKGCDLHDKVNYYSSGLRLLEQASYAIRFAVAAYGLPYELGYFNSVQGLLKLQAEPHCRYVYATSEEQTKSMQRMLHGDVVESNKYEYVLTRYSLNINEASYAVIVDHTAQIVIVTFRGTLTLADAVVDIMEGYVNVKLCTLSTKSELKNENSNNNNIRTATRHENKENTLETRIPVGFFESVREAALTLIPRLNALFTQYTNYSLYITGHSLGAVQASLFHLLYCTESITMAIVDDKDKVAMMASELHKTNEKTTLESSAISREKATNKNNNDNDNNCNVSESGESAGHAFTVREEKSTSSAITDAVAKVKCNKVHTFAFAPAPMMELNILPELQQLLQEEQRNKEDVLKENSLHAFVYGQDPVSRVDVRSFISVFVPSSAGKHDALLSNENVANHNMNSKSNDKSSSNGNANLPFVLTDSCVPTLGIPGKLYSIPHTSQRSFFEVSLQAQWRKQLILTPEALVHHFPIHYLRAINKLRVYYTNQLNIIRVAEEQANNARLESAKQHALKSSNEHNAVKTGCVN